MMEKLKGSLRHKYLFFNENVCTLEKWVRVGLGFLGVKERRFLSLGCGSVHLPRWRAWWAHGAPGGSLRCDHGPSRPPCPGDRVCYMRAESPRQGWRGTVTGQSHRQQGVSHSLAGR